MAALSIARAQDIWGGGFPNDHIDVGTNWIAGVVPPGYMAGTDTLEFNDASNTNLNIDVSGVSFAGLLLVDTDGEGVKAHIIGSNTLSLGAGGISAVLLDEAYATLSISAQIRLTASQDWSIGTNGSFDISGAILDPVSGSAGITINGGDGQYYKFDSASSTFSGGLTVLGDGTHVAVGASGTPFGTGTLSLADGVFLEPTISSLSLANAVVFGNGTTGNVVTIGSNSSNNTSITTSVLFSGSASFAANGTDSNDSEVDLQPNTTVTFSGPVDGAVPGICVDFGTVDNAVNSVFILRGNFGPNVQRVEIEDNASFILDGTGVSQFAIVEDFDTSSTGYLGLGAGYAGNVSSFLTSPKIYSAGFSGTLGFDNTTGGVTTFTDAIDLTNFTGNFVGLGSATKGQATGASNVILSGTITPPGGLTRTESETPNATYLFGGGGGTLQVTSSIVDSTWYDGEVTHPESDSLQLSVGNGPLTLILSGPLSYSGSTTVSGAALILDTPFPASQHVAMGQGDNPGGYLGSTVNSQFGSDDSGAAGTHPQDFINLLSGGSTGVVGFDDLTGGTRNITGALDMSLEPGLYLGTATKVDYSGTINPYDGIFRFAGVKGGQVTVTTPSISGSDSVVVGLPSPGESFGSVSSVIIPGSNYYSGGTTLNSGYLYVGTSNSIGTGNLLVPGPSGSFPGPVGLAPYMGNVILTNPISIPDQGLHLNYSGSPYTLYLEGIISDSTYEGSLIIDGPVSLSNSNTFHGDVTVNGTTLSVDNDTALGYGSILTAKAASTINFTTEGVEVGHLNLTAATANFTMTYGNPMIDNLSMAQGSQLTFAAHSTAIIHEMDDDGPNSGNVITLGPGTSLLMDLEEDPDYHGTFSGPSDSSLHIEGDTLDLKGASTSFSGSVYVNSTGLVIASNNSALGTGPVSVASEAGLVTNTGVTLTNSLTLGNGSYLAGFGTFSPPGETLVIQNASALVPGSATLDYGSGPSSVPVVGRLSFGATTPLTLASSGTLVVSVTDASGAAGTGYGTVDAAGGLSITASSISPFDIVLLSFAPGTNTPYATQAANFNPALPYSWTIVSSPTPITGFNASAFSIDTSSFLNPLASGSFSVSESGDNLMLNFTPVPEPSTWALLGLGAISVSVLGYRQARRRRAA